MKSCPGTKNLAWVKMSEHEILVSIWLMFRWLQQNFERRQKGNLLHHLTRTVPVNTLLLVRMCRGDSASTTGTLDPDGEKKMPSRRIAGRWHIITLQELSDYVDHELLTNRFHVSHYAGCAVLFNNDTFYSNVDVESIYLHDTRRDLPDQVMEGEQGWIMQYVLSCATFRRSPVSGQKSFTVLPLHISNIYAKKKGIAKKLILTLRAIMISQEVDLVAGDFNGTAWRCRSRDNLSTIDKAFMDSTLPTPPAPHDCGDLVPFWTIAQTPADFSNHLALNVFGKCISIVHFPFHENPLVYVPPIKAAITKPASFGLY